MVIDFEIVLNGVQLHYRGDPIDTHVWEDDDLVERLGLHAFLCDGRDDRDGRNERTVIERKRLALVPRTGDPFQAIRLMGTAAPSLGASHDELLAALTEWHPTFKLRVRGAGPDWFEFMVCNSERTMELGELAAARWPKLAKAGHGSKTAMLQQVESLGCLWLFW